MKDNKSALEIMTREIRLLYYNNCLLKHGIITTREHGKMNLNIISRYGKSRQNEAGVFRETSSHLV